MMVGEDRRLRFRIAQLWQVLWGLPQTIVGLMMFLALRRPRRRYRFRSSVVTEWSLDSGLCLGMFIFVPRDCPRSLLLHEYGHTLQSLMLGPLYLFAIVVPSMLWAGLPTLRRYRSAHNYSYYRFYCERWANLLSMRVTGEMPQGWYGRRERR